MKYKIIADSSANNLKLENIETALVPLHIIVDEEEFTDNETLNLKRMEDALSSCKTSHTACPSIGDWINAFGDADIIFCITISSTLSGSYSSAKMAKMDYEEKHPNRHVHVIDSLSTGPEMILIIEKLQELIKEGNDEKTIMQKIEEYMKHTVLIFALESMNNLVSNGRVSNTVAKLAGMLAIRIVGKASDVGDLQLLSKCRGEKNEISYIVKRMKSEGYTNGKIRIAHNNNKSAIKKLVAKIEEEFEVSDMQIDTTTGLCSYYAERGGLLIGFEC